VNLFGLAAVIALTWTAVAGVLWVVEAYMDRHDLLH
jgi:hypothetical protein